MGLIINPYRFGGGGGGGGGYNKWRLNITTTQSGGFINLREVEMRSTRGGSDITGSGTATASETNGGNTAANAFDNNTGTSWQATSQDATLEYDFGSAVTITEIKMVIGAIGDAPTALTVQYWDGSAWQTSTTVSGLVWAQTGASRYIAVGTPYASSEAYTWRLLETSRQNAGSWSTWAELSYNATAGGTDLATSLEAFGNNNGANTANCFANDGSTTFWQSGTPTIGSYIANTHTAPGPPAEVVGQIHGATGDGVLGFKFQYWDGQSAWVDYATKAFPTWTTGFQIQTVSLP